MDTKFPTSTTSPGSTEIAPGAAEPAKSGFESKDTYSPPEVPLLQRPALLKHIFKFVEPSVEQATKLGSVSTDWLDTVHNYSHEMW